MSGFGGVFADQARLGILPAQHHDPNYPVNRRVSHYGARVKRQPLDDPLHYAFAVIEDAEETYGEYQSEHLWFRKPGQRECSMWAWAANPSILVAGAPKIDPNKTGVRKSGDGEVLPLLDLDVADEAFIPRAQDTSPWASRFPGGWTGLSAKTSDPDRQVDTWHPDFLGLVDPSFGNPDNGTRVFDQTAKNEIDRDRWAYLQQIMCVLDFTHGTNPCDLSGYALALQLGGDKLEGKPGYALYADHDNAWIGSAAAKHGGPFVLGPGCKHEIGRDADGNSFRPVHLDFEALWLWTGVGDGPLHFESSKWEETQDDGPHWLQAHLRWNPNPKDHAGAQFCGRGFNGVWSWEVGTYLYVPDPDPEPEGDPQPPRGDPPPPTPPETGDPLPPRGPITGGGTRTGTGVVGGGPAIEPLEQDEIPPPELDPAAEPLLGGLDEGVEFDAEPLGAGIGSGFDGPGVVEPHSPPHGYVDDGTGGKATPVVGNDSSDYVPAYPNATQCTVFPGILFRATATDPGEYDLSGALHVGAEARTKWELSPYVGQLAGYGKTSDGSWDSLEVDNRDVGKQHPTGPGGLMFLPGNTSPADLANGTSANTNEFWVTVPQSIGSGSGRFFLGQPDPTTGKGHTGVILEATATQLNATPVSAAGVEGTTTDLLSAGGGGDVVGDATSGTTYYTPQSGTGGAIELREYEETVTGGTGAQDTASFLQEGDVIKHVWTYVTTEPDGAGAAPGDTYSVGFNTDTDRWGTSSNITVGSTTSSADYNLSAGASPDARVTATAATQYVRITPNGWSGWGSGAIRVTVLYERTAAQTA